MGAITDLPRPGPTRSFDVDSGPRSESDGAPRRLRIASTVSGAPGASTPGVAVGMDRRRKPGKGLARSIAITLRSPHGGMSVHLSRPRARAVADELYRLAEAWDRGEPDEDEETTPSPTAGRSRHVEPVRAPGVPRGSVTPL